MTRIEGRYGTYEFPDESPARGWRSGCVIILASFTVGLFIGLSIGVNAPRSAPATAPRPEASIENSAAALYLPAPTASTVSPAPMRASPVQTPARTDARPSTTVRHGVASYVQPGYGPHYLALPQGPGHTVTICARRCVTRTSTDAGPALFLQRQGRIADLSYRDFAYVCRCTPELLGVVRVTVTSGRLLPPTDR